MAKFTRTMAVIGGLTISIMLAIIMQHPAHASEINPADYYAGSFIAETNAGERYFWYVHPDTKERYAINSLNDFSRLLKNVSTGITTKNLERIPIDDESTSQIDYELPYRLRGRILLVVDNEGRSWYVNPLTLKRYYLANNQEGFDLAQSFAFDVSTDTLTKIPVTETLGFNFINYKSNQIRSAEGYDFDTYATMFDILRNEHYYKDRFTDADLFYGSLTGMARGTSDVNTEFYSPEKNKKQQEYFWGETSIEGIGAVIDARNKSIYIISVLKGSPAERAGLKSQDQILFVSGISTAEMSVDGAVSYIKGSAGSKVILTIFRLSTGSTFDVEISREKIDIPTITGETYDNGKIAYFSFTLFTHTLISEFQKLLNQKITDKTRGIIIDLRNNIGGVTQSSLMLADYWLTANQEIMTEKRLNMTTTYVASGGRAVPYVPTIILTNGETASAAEIFTAALKHYGEAMVIGTKTFGKGTGQNIVNFEDNSGLKYTTFEWFAPDGEKIDKVGITPDYIIEPEGYSDNQLQWARNLILYSL